MNFAFDLPPPLRIQFNSKNLPQEEQLLHLDTTIQQINIARASLAFRINQHKSHICRIPNEILSSILVLLPPPLQFQNDPDEHTVPNENSHASYILGTIAAVSRHWREVALSTSGLWTTLAIEVSVERVAEKIEILSIFLNNSRNLLFHLTMRFAGFHPHNGEVVSLLRSLGYILKTGAERISTLRFRDLPEYLVRFLDHRLHTSFRSLSTLQISSSDPTENGHVIQGIKGHPALRTIFLVRPKFAISFRSNVVTTIVLVKAPIELCYEALFGCPNLSSYHCYYPLLGSPLYNDRPVAKTGRKGIVVFPSMISFGWPLNRGGSICALLENVRLPSLESLHWLYDGSDPWTLVHELTVDFSNTNFIKNLPTSLVTLHIYKPPESFVPSSRFLCAPALCRVQALVLDNCISIAGIQAMFVSLSSARLMALPGLCAIRNAHAGETVMAWKRSTLDNHYGERL